MSYLELPEIADRLSFRPCHFGPILLIQVTTSNPIDIENPINIVNPNINGNANKALGGGSLLGGRQTSGSMMPLPIPIPMMPHPFGKLLRLMRRRGRLS